ncbi:MAG: 4-(cytidine 5'-diphospho)-2-C-methyl-D-erythritol kinase [Actinomycetota bacterium]|nr:4-(cytidine 5'-diphospho)-2-C-methyl-D-erythritol kinase [Actinomycetota bacterium]
MQSVLVSAPAKVNLALAVGAARADGFHSLSTVYQAVDVCDEVRASRTDGTEVSVTLDSAAPTGVPRGRDNLAVRAAELLRRRAGIRAGAVLAIRKVIPVGGGMAGGSADAAATLVACDALWGLRTPREELLALAAELGSDVPFCLLGGTALGTGRGELVSPVLTRGTYHWVFGVSDQGLSTRAVYAEFDRLLDPDTPPTVSDRLMGALLAADPVGLGHALHNDLQAPALALRPELDGALAMGAECGALGGIVSGSGPTVMFLAANREHALDLAATLDASRVCEDVLTAIGPVPGARIIGHD